MAITETRWGGTGADNSGAVVGDILVSDGSAFLAGKTLVGNYVVDQSGAANSFRFNGNVVTAGYIDVYAASIYFGQGSTEFGKITNQGAFTAHVYETYQWNASYEKRHRLDAQTGKTYLAAIGVTVGTHEQIQLKSSRAAIVSGNLLGGIAVHSDDTQLTDNGITGGTLCAWWRVKASETHTTTALGSVISIGVTPVTTATPVEIIEISGTGVSISRNLTLPSVSGTTAGYIMLGANRMAFCPGSSTFFGVLAGNTAVTGNFNVGIGLAALDAVTDGIGNTAVGRNALGSVTSGDYNAALGADAGGALTTSDHMFALGPTAFGATTGGTRSIAIGSNAALSCVAPTDCIFIGYYAGRLTGTLSNAVAIGNYAGENCGTGCVMIGHNAGQNETGTNKLYIDNTNTANPLIGGDFSARTIVLNGTITIQDAKNIVLGTTTGTKIGTAVTEKLAFYGKTPIVQPSGANQAALTNSTGGTADGTLSACGNTASADQSAVINNNFTEIFSRLNEMRTVMVNLGIFKGSA